MTSFFMCPRCLAILGSQVERNEQGVAICQTCQSRFLPASSCDYCNGKPPGERPCFEVEAYLRDWWSAIDFSDLPRHRTRLLCASKLVTGENPLMGTVMQGLFECLAAAKAFVHFTTWGMSHLMLGAFKLLSAQGVSVNGIVSSAYSSVIEEVTVPALDESLNMNIVAFAPEDSRRAPIRSSL